MEDALNTNWTREMRRPGDVTCSPCGGSSARSLTSSWKSLPLSSTVLMWLFCTDLCIGGCVSSRDLARTLPLHLATSQTGSNGPPTVTTSPSSSWVCTELQLSPRHMPTGHPLPPALSMSLPCIFSECLSTSDIAPCFGALVSTLLSKSRLSCIRWCLLHCHQDSEARVILSPDLFGESSCLGFLQLP